jgi:hypothetical protein
MSLTAQEIFTTVKTHLLQQGRKAMLVDAPDEMCAYHADNGDMCAAGRLIPSHLYNPNMEAKTIMQVFRLYPEVAEHIGRDNLVLVEALQDLHDNEPPQYWAEELNNLARRRELTP